MRDQIKNRAAPTTTIGSTPIRTANEVSVPSNTSGRSVAAGQINQLPQKSMMVGVMVAANRRQKNARHHHHRRTKFRARNHATPQMNPPAANTNRKALMVSIRLFGLGNNIQPSVPISQYPNKCDRPSHSFTFARNQLCTINLLPVHLIPFFVPFVPFCNPSRLTPAAASRPDETPSHPGSRWAPRICAPPGTARRCGVLPWQI